MILFSNVLAALALSLAQPASAPASPAAEAAPAEQRLLTVITSDDAQTQLMALILTRASLQAGVEARVLLCGPAGDLALAEPPEAAVAPLAPLDASPHGLLAGLLAEDVVVQVCAIYLPNSAHDQDDLLSGVGSARPPEIAAVMADPDSKLFTF